MDVLLAACDQAGVAYSKMRHVKALIVKRRVSFVCPQEDPANAFRTPILRRPLSSDLLHCAAKHKVGSKITLKFLGFC